MLIPIRKIVTLSRGRVTLHAWPATVADSHLLDLLTLTATLTHVRQEWQAFSRADITSDVWGSFWRLVHVSLQGQALPRPVTFADRIALLDAMWELNEVDEAEPKLAGLLERSNRLTQRLRQQARTTTA